MKCYDPILCYDNNIKRQFRHFSLANPIFKLLSNKVFNCGTCIFCRKKRAYELAIRCVLHASLYTHNCFLTLTYDESQPDYHNKLQYEDIQKFKKSLRRYCDYHYGKKIQIFNVHEYGKNGKKHWHLVVFNHDFQDKTIHTIKKGIPLFTSKTLQKLWKFGFSTIGSVTEASAMYQAQYAQKDAHNGNLLNEKKSNSKHSGIGRDYFLRNYKQILSLGYIPFQGKKIPVPRYFQKLAHKHYCHFHEPDRFFDLSDRKKTYTPFKKGEANPEISDLFIRFRDTRSDFIKQLEQQWEEEIYQYIFTDKKPDFITAAENYLYDLRNKTAKDFLGD